MLYTLNLGLIIKRFVPVWFRHSKNLQWAYVLLSWFQKMHEDFLDWRENVIIAEYRYNGLVHSLEWALNDRWDPVERRIYITVIDQLPFYHHLGDGQPPVVSLVSLSSMTGYYHLPDGATIINYLYEFLVNVPASVVFDPSEMFELLDLYRYAGRRPAIQLFETIIVGGIPIPVPVGTIIPYQGQGQEAGNQPILIEEYADNNDLTTG